MTCKTSVHIILYETIEEGVCIVSLSSQKPKEESEETELRDERTVCRTVDSDKTTGTDGQQNNIPNTSDECETNAIDTSRTEISTAAEIDKNNDSTAQEITIGMEALTANDPTLNDSKDDDEGFEENDNNVDGENDLDSDIEEDCEHENGDDFGEDDDDGWITPDNIKQIKNQMGKGSQNALPANVTVGCLTTDFAMQVIEIVRNSVVTEEFLQLSISTIAT